MMPSKFVTMSIALALTFFHGSAFAMTKVCKTEVAAIAAEVAPIDEVEKTSSEKAKVKIFDVTKLGPGTYAHKLTPEALKILVQQHENVVNSEKIIGSKLFEVDSTLNTTRIVQVGKWNQMVLGPPGGGKSALFMLMIHDLWVKQVHQMMNEVPLIGGTTEEDNKAGRDGLNIKGTILDNVEFAMIDEGEKLNAAVQAVLLSLLNPGERFITVGGKPLYADKLRSIIYTGNATLPQIIEYFVMQGQITTGPAFMNRFMAKIRVSNSLSDEAEEQIDNMKARRDYLKALAPDFPEILKDAVFQGPPELDYDTIERFANAAFELTPEAYMTMRQFIRQLKKETNEAKRASEARNKDQDPTEPYVLTPSVEFSERVRGDVAKWVRISAALDFLRSPMATPENIAKFTANKIKLGPNSLWRTWNMLTTVGSHRTIFDPYTKTVHFNSRMKGTKLIPYNVDEMIANASDSTEQLELTHIKQAQERFAGALATRIGATNNSLQRAARFLPTNLDDINFEAIDFEIALAELGGTDVIQLPQAKAPVAQAATITSASSSSKKKAQKP